MILLLLISIAILLFLCFVFFKFDLASPSILLIVPYLISVVFLLSNKNEWQVSISDITFFVVFFGLFLTFLGEVFARIIVIGCRSKKLNCNSLRLVKLTPILPKSYFINLVIIYMVFFSIFYARHILAVVDSSGASSEVILGAYRAAEKKQNLVLTFFLVINLPLAYFFLLSFVENYVYHGLLKLKLLVPVFLYAVTLALTSSRIGVLYLLVSTVLFSFITYQKKRRWRFSFSPKVAKKILVSLLITLIIFYFLGFLTGKSNYHSFYYIVSLYIGSSIAALDSFLLGFQYSFSQFGSETLVSLRNFLSFLRIDVELSDGRILDFVHLGNMPSRTNIYTSFRRVANDYGFFGIVIYQFFIGFLFSLLYQVLKVKKGYFFEFIILVYVYFSQYLIFSFVDERILVNVLSLTSFVQIIQFFILVRFCSDKAVLLK